MPVPTNINHFKANNKGNDNTYIFRLKDLEDVRRRRLDALRTEPATIQALDWLGRNRDKLVGHVYGPICLEINIKNMHYADAVETLLGHFMKVHFAAF